MKSIRSKLWISTTLLVFGVILAIWVFQIVLLDYFYINKVINDLSAEGEKIVKLIKQKETLEINDKNVVDELKYFLNQYQAGIDILDNNKNIVFSQGSIPARGMLYREINLSKILQGEKYVQKLEHQRFNISIITIGIPIQDLGILLIFSPIAPINEASSVLQQQLSIILFVSLIIATILSLMLSKRFTKPILEIDKVAKEISNGNYNKKVNINSQDEIGKLSKTINDMSYQLSKIDKLRKEFIGNISHEFKTPLGLIRGYTELTEDTMSNKELKKYKNNLDIILDETSKLDLMIKDSLLLSQMESGFIELQLSEFNLNDVINETISKLKIISQKHNITINFTQALEHPIVNADKQKISQVLYNLITNAIYHSKTSDRINIYVNNLNHKIKVEIRDYGEGISKNEVEFVWDRFYKINSNKSGTGLGMTICKNILEAHNFEYGIESTEGKGTNVWFIIKN